MAAFLFRAVIEYRPCIRLLQADLDRVSASPSTPERSAGSSPALTWTAEWMVSSSSLCFYYKLDAYLKNERSINNLKQIKGLYYHHCTQAFQDNSAPSTLMEACLALLSSLSPIMTCILRKIKTKQTQKQTSV